MLKRKITTRYSHFGMYFWIEQEEFEIPLIIKLPNAWKGKLSRGINRLLPVGHRYRGDVGL